MKLLENPFYILGATTQDDRRRIMEFATEKSLTTDENVVRDAMAVLTHPRRRLAAEVGWLLGLDHKRLAEILSVLDICPEEIRNLDDLFAITHANLLADGLVRTVERLSPSDIAQWIVHLARVHEYIDEEETARLLNEDRSISHFPLIPDIQHVVEELAERRKYYCQAMKNALDKLPTNSWIWVVTMAVSQATNNGKKHAPTLIEDLVNSFEVKAQNLLELETENIDALIEKVRNAVENKDSKERIASFIRQLEKATKNWDKVAQPIQVITQSQGLPHEPSYEVAGKIRNLALHLYNKHGHLDLSKRLTVLLQEVFAEVDLVVDQADKDTDSLDNIAKQRARFQAEMKARAEARKHETASPTQGRENPGTSSQTSHRSVSDDFSLGASRKSAFKSFVTKCVVLGAIVVGALSWFNNSTTENKSGTSSRSTYTQPNPSPVTAKKIEFSKPPVGQNNLLSVSQIRWCLREDIWLETIRSTITNAQVDQFNTMVSDFNSRCGRYQYRPGTLERARREVEQQRVQIIANLPSL